jgi:opacity protein-like surface antigen
MRIESLKITALLFGVMLFSQDPAFGESRGWYVKLQGGVSSMADTDFSGEKVLGSGSVDTSFDTGAAFGGAIGYGVTPTFDLEIDYTYRQNDISSGKRAGRTVLSGGDYASVAVMMNGIYRFEVDYAVKPYLGIGIGFLQEVDSDLEFADGGKLEDLEDRGFAWQGLAGLAYPLTPHFEIFGEVRYISASNIDLEKSGGSVSADYRTTSALAGLTYRF